MASFYESGCKFASGHHEYEDVVYNMESQWFRCFQIMGLAVCNLQETLVISRTVRDEWLTDTARIDYGAVISVILCFSCGLTTAHNRDDYTLSHPENDRDVTQRAQGYTLQDASCMRQSFLNAGDNTQVAREMTSVFVWNTR